MHFVAKMKEREGPLKVTKNAFLRKPQYCFCDQQQHKALLPSTNDFRNTAG